MCDHHCKWWSETEAEWMPHSGRHVLHSSSASAICLLLQDPLSLLVTWNNTEGLLWMTTVFLLLLFPRYGHHNLIFCAHCLVSRGMRGHRTVSPGPPLNVVAVGYVLLKVSWNGMKWQQQREGSQPSEAKWQPRQNKNSFNGLFYLRATLSTTKDPQ